MTPAATYPLIPASRYSKGSNLPVDRIVIHGTVSPTRPGQARNTAKYFQSASAGGSAHYVVDPIEIIQCAKDNVICWHAPPNTGSIGVEFCDWVVWSQGGGKTVADKDSFWAGKTQAQFNGRWTLPPWDQMLRRGAKLVHDLCLQHKLPITRISVAQLLAGNDGITAHSDISKAWRQTDHTDPQWSAETWGRFIEYVVAAGKPPATKPPTVPPVVKPPNTPRTVPSPGVLAVDGGLGPATIRRWQQVMKTTVDSKISVPSTLVLAVQKRLNDGLPGPNLVLDGKGIIQDGKRYATVAALQRYLGTTSDGILSYPSSGAVKALQKRLNTNRF